MQNVFTQLISSLWSLIPSYRQLTSSVQQHVKVLIQTMSWLIENVLFFLITWNNSNKIEPGKIFYKTNALCIQYERSLKLQSIKLTFSHLDIYTWYSIYSQMKYCKYSLQAVYSSSGMCVRCIPVTVPPWRLLVFEHNQRIFKP